MGFDEIEIELDAETESALGFSSEANEFTGSKRESLLPPGTNEPICLISYEITHILLGDGPANRSGFWKSYRRELDLNLKTNYTNYHITLCRHQLVSLKIDFKEPIFFRNNRLTIEKVLDPAMVSLLGDSRFN